MVGHFNYMIETAIKYGALGLKVFPLNGKKPAINGWQKKASSDEAEIRQLFAIKHTGIGLACGKISGVTVLDVDVKNGSNGFETLKNAGIELPNTPITITPTGGRHYFFKYTDKLKNMVSILGEKSGLDIRNDGGYVILPPSIGEKNVAYTTLEDQSLWN